MKPTHDTRKGRFLASGGAALPCLLLAATLLTASGCGGAAPEEPPPGDTPATGPSQEEALEDPSLAETVRNIFPDGSNQPPVPRGPALPELAFEIVEIAGSGTWREHPLLCDFTGDGRDDIVASNREEDGLSTWQSAPDGSFPRRIEGLPRDLMYGGSAGANFDGDGDTDLVFCAHKNGLRLFLNDGHMSWSEAPKIECPFLVLDCAVGDFDRDGKPDVVGIAQFGGGVGIWLGDGQGGFEFQKRVGGLPPESTFGTQVETGDFDGDGADDFVLTAKEGAHVLLSRMKNGSLIFEERSGGLPRTVGGDKIGNSLRGAVPADFDGDGDLEVAVCSLANPSESEDQQNYLGVFALLEDGSWEQIDTGLLRNQAYHDVQAADFDGDGNVDLLTVGIYDGTVLHKGDGAGGFETVGTLPDNLRGGRLALGDADGDGRIDVLQTYSATKGNADGGEVRLYLNRAEAWEE